ncbi:putative metallo-hydrolase YflN [Desulfosporosinus acididurans]|uniref:Putative metallo-hydrolase YflN n=1 Tax=Desulfosporosinus acididurans TaxID=476652 RepID=A0A0J1FWP2_9FIRM|nr:MBL fold metallo-hydrolase [Desulfosporosinus acididurans]KLU67722.1 putative metallo-hydrolase YflN [Desulfosporosinus acididurans]
MLVTDGIHLIDGVKGAHVYVVTGLHTFLVDSGMPGQEDRILKYLNSIGLDPTAAEGIILTHYDIDHVGSAVILQKTMKCPLYAHSLEIPFINGQLKRHGIKRWLPLLTRPIYGKLTIPENICSLKDQKLFGEWEIIPTPGHTPGHIVLYRNGVAIVGDLFQGGELRLAPKFFTWDKEKLIESARTITSRPLRWILPGHGPATPASSHWLDNLQRTLK